MRKRKAPSKGHAKRLKQRTVANGFTMFIDRIIQIPLRGRLELAFRIIFKRGFKPGELESKLQG